MFIPQARFDPSAPEPITVPKINTTTSDLLSGSVIVSNGKVEIVIGPGIRALGSNSGPNNGSVAIGKSWFDFLCDASTFTNAYTPVYWNATGNPVDQSGSTITALLGTGCLTTSASGNYFVGFTHPEQPGNSYTINGVSSVPSPLVLNEPARARAWLQEVPNNYQGVTYGSVIAGQVAQGTREASDTQVYALGTKRVTPDGRVFRYVKARTALNTEFGACYAAKTITNAVAPTQGTGIGVIGATTLKQTVGSGDGLAGNGAIAANELVGGYIVIGNGTSQHPQNRMIIANTAVSAGGGTTTITVDEALDQNITASTTNLETIMNPWILSDGNTTSSGYVTFRGMPACQLAINQYGWVQTAGPCWITSDGNTCNSDGDRQIYFANNGSCVSGNDVTGDVNVQQLAGHAMDMSGSGASNAPFVNLCLEYTA